MNGPVKSELSAALSRAQAKMKSIPKTGKNSFFNNSKYAEIDVVFDQLLPILSSEGLSLTQTTEITENRIILKTTLRHSSGESESSYWPLGLLTDKQQSLGSSLSYGRRYTAMAISGLSANEEEDDGNNASGKIDNTTQNQQERGAIESKESHPMPPSGNTRVYSGPSEAQLKRLYAIANSSGWPRGMAEAWVKRSYEKKPSELMRSEYDATCDALKATKFNDILKEELKPFMPIDIKAQFEAEKKKQSSYVDHVKLYTEPKPFSDGESIPF